MRKNAYARVESFAEYSGEGTNLIAHPTPNYNLMGIAEYNVISVMKGHAPGVMVTEKNDLLYDVFLYPDLATWRELLETYQAQQVLVPLPWSYRDVKMLLNGRRMERNDFYELYRVDVDDLDDMVLSRSPDPELELSSVEYGYTRYEAWADIQQGGVKEIVIEAVKDTTDEAEAYTYLRAESEDPEGSLLFINRGYIEVDPALQYSLKTVSRETKGEPNSYLFIYEYSQPSNTALLDMKTTKYYERFDYWTERELIIGPETAEDVHITWNPDTRYVKIGMILCHHSTGQVEVDLIELSPEI